MKPSRAFAQGVERPLDGLERLFWLLGRAAVFNIVASARLEGPLAAEDLRRALDAAQRRHPLLGARIALREHGPVFTAGAGPIPLRVEPLGPGEAWMRAMEEELHAPFSDDGPLARGTLLQGADSHVLLVAFHHAIGDGFAAWSLLTDLVRVASGQHAALPPLPPLPGMAQMLPARDFGLPMPPPAAPPARLPQDDDVTPGERRTRLLQRHIEAEQLEALAARARAEGTTVQGALAAAMLQAAALEAGGKRATLGLNSPLNLRDRLTQPVGAAFGLFAFAPPLFLEADPAAPLWGLAREVRARLRALAETDAALAVLAQLEVRVPREANAAQAMPGRIAAQPPVAVGVTNLGRVPPAPAGPLRVRSFDCAASLELAGASVVVYAATFEGRLALTFMHPEPVVGRARAARIADQVVARLLGALA